MHVESGATPVAAVKSPRGDGLVEIAAVVVSVAMTTLVWMRLFGAWELPAPRSSAW